MRSKGLTKAKVREALIKNRGLRTQAAEALGVTGPAIAFWIRKHPELAQIRAEGLEGLKDIAEGHLVKAVLDGDMKWIRYFLDAHARDRGYGNKFQLTGKNDEPLFDTAGMAAVIASMTDEQRQAFDILRTVRPERPDGVAGVEPTAH